MIGVELRPAFRLGFLVVSVAFVVASPSLGVGAPSDHAAFQTRPPVQCGPFSTFDGSVAAAKRIFQCDQERNALGSGSNLYLIEDLVIQVGAARAQTLVETNSLTDAVVASRVYPIRGTYTWAQCSIVRDQAPLDNRGRSCNEYFKSGQGVCWSTTFGDWRCTLSTMGDTRPPLMGVAPRNWGQFQPISSRSAETQPAPDPTSPAPDTSTGSTAPAPPPVQSGGRRIVRDANRPIAMHDTVEYEEPDNPGAPTRCVVQGVFPGAYKLQCTSLNPMNQIVRDIDVRRPGGQAPASSAVGAVASPFKPNDLVLASTMGLQDERYWKLCVVLRNQVSTSNSYVVDCGYGPVNVLPSWVRPDPDFG
jgi:hypothetical protein